MASTLVKPGVPQRGKTPPLPAGAPEDLWSVLAGPRGGKHRFVKHCVGLAHAGLAHAGRHMQALHTQASPCWLTFPFHAVFITAPDVSCPQKDMHPEQLHSTKQRAAQGQACSLQCESGCFPATRKDVLVPSGEPPCSSLAHPRAAVFENGLLLWEETGAAGNKTDQKWVPSWPAAPLHSHVWRAASWVPGCPAVRTDPQSGSQLTENPSSEFLDQAYTVCEHGHTERGIFAYCYIYKKSDCCFCEVSQAFKIVSPSPPVPSAGDGNGRNMLFMNNNILKCFTRSGLLL